MPFFATSLKAVLAVSVVAVSLRLVPNLFPSRVPQNSASLAAPNGAEMATAAVASSSKAATTALAYPKLIAFDLDYTLWPLWVDTHVSQPLRRPSSQPLNLVKDPSGTSLSFYRDVAGILFDLRGRGVRIAACSRTHAPEAARQALNGLFITPDTTTPSKSTDPKGKAIPAMQLFDDLEIYPGSKIQHFNALHRKTGIEYSEMLFFDDEKRNKEVEKLGVKFCFVPDGLDRNVFEQGLKSWRSARGLETKSKS